LPTNIGLNAESQNGKSQAVFWIANRMEQILTYGGKWKEHSDEWELWDYKKYCATDIEDFINIFDESYEKTIVLEECADIGLDTASFFNMLSKAFARIERTQGSHLNRVFMITPFLNDLLNVHKRKINFILESYYKDVEHHQTVMHWGRVKINCMTLKEYNIKVLWRKPFTIRYNDKAYKAGYDYCEYLKIFKKDYMQNIKNDVKIFKEKLISGYNPNKAMTERNCPDWVKKLL
jgi:hypothetical protein